MSELAIAKVREMLAEKICEAMRHNKALFGEGSCYRCRKAVKACLTLLSEYDKLNEPSPCGVEGHPRIYWIEKMGPPGWEFCSLCQRESSKYTEAVDGTWRGVRAAFLGDDSLLSDQAREQFRKLAGQRDARVRKETARDCWLIASGYYRGEEEMERRERKGRADVGGEIQKKYGLREDGPEAAIRSTGSQGGKDEK